MSITCGHATRSSSTLAAVIEFIDDLPDGCIGARASGYLTLDDYETAIEPDVESIIERHAKLRLILHLDDNFEGFGEGAWGQLTDELLHVHFHRGALVTNDGHVAGAVNILKWTLRGHVRTFHNGEFDQAVHWITT
jgi:hypothetical protein